MVKNYWKKFWDSNVTKSQDFIELNDIAYGSAKKVRVGIDVYRENVIVYKMCQPNCSISWTCSLENTKK